MADCIPLRQDLTWHSYPVCALSVSLFRCTSFVPRKDYGFLFSYGHVGIDHVGIDMPKGAQHAAC